MEQGYHGGSKPTFTHAIEAVQRSADGPPLPSSHKETQPFLQAIQRSADGSSNSRETTQPFLLNHTTTSPLSHPARKSQPHTPTQKKTPQPPNPGSATKPSFLYVYLSHMLIYVCHNWFPYQSFNPFCSKSLNRLASPSSANAFASP